MNETDKQSAIEILNRIMELELAGVVRYTHYSLMVFGYNRIPIVSWLKGNADESLAHAFKAGELVGRDISFHWQAFFVRLEVLADGHDVA